MGRTNIKSLLTSFTSEGDFLAIVASDGNVKVGFSFFSSSLWKTRVLWSESYEILEVFYQYIVIIYCWSFKSSSVKKKKGDFFEALVETWILDDLREITYWLDKKRRDLSSSFSVWFHFSWEQGKKIVFWKCEKLGQWCTHYRSGVEKPQCYSVFISGFAAILFCFMPQVVSLHACNVLFFTIHLLALALYDFTIS